MARLGVCEIKAQILKYSLFGSRVEKAVPLLCKHVQAGR